MIPKRTCENCGNHLGLHDMAVCEYTDKGIFKTSICIKWTGKKYNRTQQKHQADFELKIAEHEAQPEEAYYA